MQITKMTFEGVLVVHRPVYPDNRGSFMEVYRQDDGLPVSFAQDNVSISKRGVIRGLHYQLLTPQAKLVTVLNGSILDVAVDIRKGSPWFGKKITIKLVAGGGIQFFIPAGFAHGFQALEDETVVSYKCSTVHNPLGAREIRYNDPDINVPWEAIPAIVSDKDKAAPLLQYAECPVYEAK